MRVAGQKEMDAVLRLDGVERHAHAIKRMADSETVWGLWREGGWAMMADGEGQAVLPLWPAREYAELCRIDECKNYEVRMMSLAEVLDDFLPSLDRSPASHLSHPGRQRCGRHRRGVLELPSARARVVLNTGLDARRMPWSNRPDRFGDDVVRLVR